MKKNKHSLWIITLLDYVIPNDDNEIKINSYRIRSKLHNLFDAVIELSTPNCIILVRSSVAV